MIDDEQLKRIEAENIACGDVENEWLVRNARRYLALRAVGVAVDDCNREVVWVAEYDLDASADRLLEDGE